MHPNVRAGEKPASLLERLMKQSEAYQLELEIEQHTDESFNRWVADEADRLLSLDPDYDKWSDMINEAEDERRPF